MKFTQWILGLAAVLICISMAHANSKLILNISGIDPLANGYHYEGWAIVDGAPVSTGKFNVNENGEFVDLAGNVIPGGEFMLSEDITTATAIVLTIEPDGDPDPAPAATHLLAGDVSNLAANLTVGHPAAIGDDYSGASGEYILATPTNGSDTNENSGIWFLTLTTTVTMDFTGLDPLLNGYHYEGWAIVDGAPISTGRFNVNENGELVDLDGNIIENGEFIVGQDVSGATAIVLTIEPVDDPDPAPAATHLLAGDVANLSASLTTAHPAAIGDDFLGATGNYILATPTNGDTTNENSGIWFLDLSSGSPATGLSLPALPDGWQYEGWAVINGQPVTSGRFLAVDAVDFSAPFSGPMPGPPFPGEDYLENAPGGLTFPTDLSGGVAVISIEPEPDDSPAPFTLKPLVGMIPGDAADHFTYAMDNNAAVFTTGTVTLNFNGTNAGLGLATLPDGWEYEGWVVIDGQPVTTGRFLEINAVDFAAPFSGPMPGPPYPGEDFLENAPDGLTFPTDLAGGVAVISIEPEPDDSPAPFTLKPVVGMIPAEAVDHVTYAAGNNAAVFPSGSAIIEAATGIEDFDNSALPAEFKLFDNFPNPFNPSTNIRFQIPRAGFVTLAVYNVAGEKVASLVNETLQAGSYQFNFDAANLSTGVYLYRFEVAGFSQVKKMILIK